MLPLRRSAADPAASHAFARARPAQIAIAALVCGAVCIAFAPIFVRLSEVGPTATAFYRLLFALPVLWLWRELEARKVERPRRPLSGLDRAGVIAAGLFFAGDLAFWHWSIRFTTVANATLLANFAPIFVTLAAFLIYGERASRQFLAGMMMALAGACVLMEQSVSLSLSHLLGDTLGLITAVFYAGYIISVGRLRARLSTAAIMAGSGLVTSMALLPIAILSDERLIASTVYGWAVLAALALISHAGGQSLIAYALAHLPAAFSSVTLLLQPAVAALLAWAILGEALGLWQALGALVILASIYLARRGNG